MKRIFEVGVLMIAVMIFFCPVTLGQNDGQDKPAAEAKPLVVSITLNSGEVITGLLVKIDKNFVEYKVNDVVQRKSMHEVSHLRFGKSATTAAKTGPTIPAIDQATSVATSDSNDQQTTAPTSINLRPAILRKEKAGYTDEARRNGVQGIVVLNVVFAADGTVTSIKVLSGLPDGLNEKAIEAAKKIRFRPAIKDGKPVSVRANLEYSFDLGLNLPSPKLLLPPHNEVITTGLRKTTLYWDPVPLATSYKIRLEKESQKPGKWTLDHETVVTKPFYDFNFAGAEVWRWRVKGVNASERDGNWSDWSILRVAK